MVKRAVNPGHDLTSPRPQVTLTLVLAEGGCDIRLIGEDVLSEHDGILQSHTSALSEI